MFAKAAALVAAKSAGASSSSSSSSASKVPVVSLSTEQNATVQLALSGRSLFFTGAAGTGKSLVLRELIKQLRAAGRSNELAITASTGIAAVALGGTTLHSFAGVGLGNADVQKLIQTCQDNRKAMSRWTRTKILLIDEISMLDAAFFNSLEEIARAVRKSPLPFGGIQLILCGGMWGMKGRTRSVHNSCCSERILTRFFVFLFVFHVLSCRFLPAPTSYVVLCLASHSINSFTPVAPTFAIFLI
jgi:hypothetical protein